jgi:hypothetical protein
MLLKTDLLPWLGGPFLVCVHGQPQQAPQQPCFREDGGQPIPDPLGVWDADGWGRCLWHENYLLAMVMRLW